MVLISTQNVGGTLIAQHNSRHTRHDTPLCCPGTTSHRIESKYQEQSILSSTLQKELDEKMADTEGKKVKALRNTVFQFNEEKTVIVDQVIILTVFVLFFPIALTVLIL